MEHAPLTLTAPPASAPINTRTPAEPQVLGRLRAQVLETDPEYQHLHKTSSLEKHSGLLDFLIATSEQAHDAALLFSRLRWGGQVVYASRDRREVELLSTRLTDLGFAPARPNGWFRLGRRIPLLSPKAHYLAARKVWLIPPREFSDRFTYHLELEHRPGIQVGGSVENATDQWIVRKEIPAYERVLARLKFKGPDTSIGVLEKRARKFVDQIFPLFLTREAAMLKIIERDCPREYLHCFPRVVDLEKDAKGYVTRLWTTWLRNGGQPLSLLDFARQAAELVWVLHEKIGIIHLDLRMDNIVITERGVGFIDFGSAVRVNENIQQNAVLSTLFGELMRTSQIQRMIDKMATAGALTSQVIRDAYQQADKGVDLFYLAMQISQPTANPDLNELIRFDRTSPEAVALAKLTNEILKPQLPGAPQYRTARDVLDAIRRIEAIYRPAPRHRAVTALGTQQPGKPKVYIWD